MTGTGPRTRVALVATHPIQYQVPWFQHLAARPGLDLKVFFGLIPDAVQQGVDFGVPFEWDIPLREGYEWELLPNLASNPALGNFRGCSTPGIFTALRDWRPDVALLTGWHSMMLIQALWACVRLGVPRVVRGESNNLVTRVPWKRLGHRVWLKAFDRFLAIGKANRAFYRGAGVPDRRIFDCPYFIDNRRFADAANECRDRRAGLRQAWGVPGNAPCFLYVGKLVEKKRPLDLLRALRKTRDAMSPVHLLMVGAGRLMDQAQDLIRREGLPVTVTGFLNQTEIAGAYVAADCLVLPSDAGETWGLVVNEAMACGLPAIVSDQVGCGPDLITEGETGGVFALGDIDGLAKKMESFAADPSRLQAMGARAQRRVLADYSVDKAIEGTLAAIRDTLGRA